MLGLKLNHVSKRGHWRCCYYIGMTAIPSKDMMSSLDLNTYCEFTRLCCGLRREKLIAQVQPISESYLFKKSEWDGVRVIRLSFLWHNYLRIYQRIKSMKCYFVSRHCLNHYWCAINKALWNSIQQRSKINGNLTEGESIKDNAV